MSAPAVATLDAHRGPEGEGPRFAPPRRPLPAPRTLAAAAVLAALFAASVWSLISLRINVATVIDSVSNAAKFLARIFPLDFPSLGEIVSMTGLTLAIVFLATLLAVILGLPVAVLAATNTAPNRATRLAARVLIVIARAIPDLVLAIVFFRIFGLGALPGILAMGLHSVGMVGKLYADAIESIDEGPVEAVRAAGGGRVQQVVTAVIPQVMPQIIATGLHRFDINLRTSVILGYVGVVGIGKELSDAMRTMQYDRGMAWALIVLILCVGIELLSGALRARLLRSPGAAQQGLYGFVMRRMPGAAAAQSAPALPGDEVQRTPDGAVRVSPGWSADRIRRLLTLVVVLAIVAASGAATQLDPVAALASLANLPQTLAMFFPPSSGGILPELGAAMVTTLQIGLAATLLGGILSVPIGVLAAANVAPSRGVAAAFRAIIVGVRAIPDLILAIIFIVITGLGPVAGTFALAIGSIGLLSKLIADPLEETDYGVQEAVRMNGATRVQVFFAATVRQAMPALVAHVLYQLDTNIRSATLLGIVGAGGIGFYLLNSARVMQFDVVTFIICLILATVLLVEGLSVWTRSVIR